MPPRGPPHAEGSRHASEPLLATFRLLDLEFVFSVVLSLFAVVFAYDAVSGEKESGTLRLVFSNPVPRHLFILGKMAGAFLDAFRALGVALSRFTERWVPDSWVICMILTSIALLLAVGAAGVGVEEAVLAWGDGVRWGYDAGTMEIADVGPTILYLLGLPVAPDMDGRVIQQFFKPQVLRDRPLFVNAGYRVLPREILSDTVERESLKKKLESLGYIR